MSGFYHKGFGHLLDQLSAGMALLVSEGTCPTVQQFKEQDENVDPGVSELVGGNGARPLEQRRTSGGNRHFRATSEAMRKTSVFRTPGRFADPGAASTSTRRFALRNHFGVKATGPSGSRR